MGMENTQKNFCNQHGNCEARWLEEQKACKHYRPIQSVFNRYPLDGCIFYSAEDVQKCSLIEAQIEAQEAV